MYNCIYTLTCTAYAEKFTDSPKGVSLYVISCFYIDAFKILSLGVDNLILMCLSIVLFGLILLENVMKLDICFYSKVSEVFSHYSMK